MSQDDKEQLQIFQNELKKLQRQYRIMESDKNSYSSEIKNDINKQRKIIDLLENEKKTLLEKLMYEKKKPDKLKYKTYEKLLKEQKAYEEEIEEKKNELLKINNEIKKLEEKHFDNNSKNDMRTTRMNEQIKRDQDRILLLQNRLHTETVKYNKMLTTNSSLRESLDNLLKDKKQFNQFYCKLLAKLNKGKKLFLQSMEQAITVWDQREEEVEKLRTLYDKDEQQLSSHNKEMRDLQRQLDHLTQLQGFLSVKGQKRIMMELEEKEYIKKEKELNDKRKVTEKYEIILRNIVEFSQQNDMKLLASLFEKQEEENFALFNYINELNNEIENLQEVIKDLEKCGEKTCEEKEETENENMDELKEELKEKENEIKEMKEKYVKTCEIIQEMYKQIEDIFNLIKDDDSDSPLILLVGKIFSKCAIFFTYQFLHKITQLKSEPI